MTRHLTLFGRKMRKVHVAYQSEPDYCLGEARVEKWSSGYGARLFQGEHLVYDLPRTFEEPHAAARALERKIVAAHRRLGKLMAGTKGRSK